MTALQIAGKQNARLLVKHLTRMHMPQGPVIIALRDQCREVRRRVGIVPGAAGQARVQETDIEEAGHGRRIGRNKVLINRTFREAAAMDRNRQFLDPDRLGGAAGKYGDIRGQDELFGDNTLCIMISLNDEGPDPLSLQPDHLPAKEQPGVKILPVAVIEIPGQEEKVHTLADGPVDQPFERAPCRRPQPLDRCAVVPVEPA